MGDETNAILERAKKALADYGWQKYDIGEKTKNGFSPMCIIGAINFGIHGLPDYPPGILQTSGFGRGLNPAYDKVIDALGVTNLYEVASWNNREERKEGEVVVLLDKAIAGKSC